MPALPDDRAPTRQLRSRSDVQGDGSEDAGPFAEPGQRFGDFEILSVLGTGSCAQVFLARQVSLGRHVALKISFNRGSEARALASLEHDHIVRVFSETVEPERGLRLLCMQYVAGTTLERVIDTLLTHPPETWNGSLILAAVDALSTHAAALDPAALRDRELLQQSDFVEAVCWIGARLAEALAYAHRRGILHRDIKPANILMNRYGRPLLVDFNLALDAAQMHGAGGELFGGTLPYMAPEHLDAFNADSEVSPEVVDQRSDLFSLGVVLFEVLTGHEPFDVGERRPLSAQSVRALAAARRCGPPRLQLPQPMVSDVLERTLRRCVAPDPADRYQTAAEMALALEGCRELHRAERDLPPATWLTRAALRRPFLMLLVLAFVPQLIGSVVNIWYNSLCIVGDLTPGQQTLFARLVVGYNLVVYPACLAVPYLLLMPLYRGCQRLGRLERMEPVQVALLRRRALELPLWTVGLSCVGWLPGGLLFPVALHLLAGPVAGEVFARFFVSFTIAGLIALTYSVFGVQFVVLRVLYPRLWSDGQGMRETARAELRHVAPRLRLFQLLAGLIPLAGAILMIVVGPEEFSDSSYRSFRLLLTALIALGMLGFWLAVLVSGVLTQTLISLTGTGQRRGATGSP
jgi:serine/threonine protein kinase